MPSSILIYRIARYFDKKVNDVWTTENGERKNQQPCIKSMVMNCGCNDHGHVSTASLRLQSS